jgi:hypothetical protein
VPAPGARARRRCSFCTPSAYCRRCPFRITVEDRWPAPQGSPGPASGRRPTATWQCRWLKPSCQHLEKAPAFRLASTSPMRCWHTAALILVHRGPGIFGAQAQRSTVSVEQTRNTGKLLAKKRTMGWPPGALMVPRSPTGHALAPLVRPRAAQRTSRAGARGAGPGPRFRLAEKDCGLARPYGTASGIRKTGQQKDGEDNGAGKAGPARGAGKITAWRGRISRA